MLMPQTLIFLQKDSYRHRDYIVDLGKLWVDFSRKLSENCGF